MKATYSVIFTTFRSGTVKTQSVAYQSDEEISSGEEYNHMATEIARHAVSQGAANSISDVTITSVSLLNPNRDIVTLATQELERKYLELYEAASEEVAAGGCNDGSILPGILQTQQEQYNSIKEGMTDEQ